MRDLHCHLSGSTNPVVLWRLIRRAGLKTQSKTFAEFRKSLSMQENGTHDLPSYLDTLHHIDDIQSSPSGVEESVYSAFESAYLAGCTELELRFNPTKRSKNGSIDMDQLLISGRSGMEKARADFGIEGKLMLCLGRDCTPEANEALFIKAAKYHNRGICGIDLAGPYTGNHSDQRYLFEKLYFAANVMGMETTCHVGEIDHEGIEDDIQFVLEKLKPSRIGHGIQLLKYPGLIRKAQKCTFEICMTSNVTTKAVNSYNEFKGIFRKLEENHLKYILCTDATYTLETNIQKEYEIYRNLKSSSYEDLPDEQLGYEDWRTHELRDFYPASGAV